MFKFCDYFPWDIIDLRAKKVTFEYLFFKETL